MQIIKHIRLMVVVGIEKIYCYIICKIEDIIFRIWVLRGISVVNLITRKRFLIY